MIPLQPLKTFKAGIDSSPITIDNWQYMYAATYGDWPDLFIKEVTTDPFGNDAERVIPDATIYHYMNGDKLDRIMIVYGGGTLSNDLKICIK